MRKYVTLLRIKIALVFFFPLTLGFSVAAEANPDIGWSKALFAILAFFCGSFFSSTMNFYSDAEADRLFRGRFKDMDLSRQPFATGEMGGAETAAAFAVSGAGCLLFSLLAGTHFAAFMVSFALVIGILYSHPRVRLKAVPLADILCNVLAMGLTLLAGMSLGVDYLPPGLFLAWGALFIALVYIPTVANDVPFDRAVGYRTSGVVFGAERMIASMPPLVAAMLPPAAWMLPSPGVVWQFKLITAVLTSLSIPGVALILYCWHPPHIELRPDVVLVPMYPFIAFFLICGLVRLAQA